MSHMPSVYIGSSLHNAELVRHFRDRFVSNGISVTYDWTTHGQVFTEEELRKYGVEEVKGVKNADLFFMLPPARFGTHIELGIAIGCDKPIVMTIGENVEMKTFYLLPQVHLFLDQEQAFQKALEILKK